MLSFSMNFSYYYVLDNEKKKFYAMCKMIIKNAFEKSKLYVIRQNVFYYALYFKKNLDVYSTKLLFF